ncbi:hypothetical protein EVAR_64408_1 [Eumeta japonica]|uniref:Uncharacterized protein n=1 Tax=Eumeta variegata TaxID=151549 RepID=A0A4C1ZYQ7_EUMVA|nr:hypothetical protein EVAR_64408_1 [Eumeta japonica]
MVFNKELEREKCHRLRGSSYCKERRLYKHLQSISVFDGSFTVSAEYIQPCSRSDPQLDACIKHAFNHLRPYLARGLTDLGVPPVEPLRISRLVMENDVGPVRVTAAFSNITVLGPSNYTVTKIR